MDISYFKDLSHDEQEAAFEQFNSGEKLYGLSSDDDTHIKCVVMVAMSQAKQLHSPDSDLSVEVVFGIGMDKKGLYVSNLPKEIIDTMREDLVQ